MKKRKMVLVKPVESKILILRGHKIILDSDLAELYGVPVKRLNEQVKRNAERFPADFMFQLSAKEHDSLKSQIATSSKARGGRRSARDSLQKSAGRRETFGIGAEAEGTRYGHSGSDRRDPGNDVAGAG